MFLSGDLDRIHESRLLILAVVLVVAAVPLSALGFEHLGGYIPCKLCLEQREPWYAAIPVAFLAMLGSMLRWPSFVTRGLMVVAALLMAYSVILGVHHAGVEWQWWEGPGDCGVVEGGVSATTGGLLQQLEESVPPSCDDAALRILGLSFAGWNAVASLATGMAILWILEKTRST